MFTGLIEEIGCVRAIRKRAGYQQTTVGAQRVLEDVRTGDSITLNGACHTVVVFDKDGFTVESVDETLRRTTLGGLRVGSPVNLERAVKLGDRLGGHLVAGHVDGVGRVLQRKESADNTVFQIGLPEELAPYVAEKGSITVDGISLTVVSAGTRDFTVTVIPHTLAVTTMGGLRMGDGVNLEVDLVARYLERLVKMGGGGEGLSEERLRGMGY